MASRPLSGLAATDFMRIQAPSSILVNGCACLWCLGEIAVACTVSEGVQSRARRRLTPAPHLTSRCEDSFPWFRARSSTSGPLALCAELCEELFEFPAPRLATPAGPGLPQAVSGRLGGGCNRLGVSVPADRGRKGLFLPRIFGDSEAASGPLDTADDGVGYSGPMFVLLEAVQACGTRNLRPSVT